MHFSEDSRLFPGGASDVDFHVGFPGAWKVKRVAGRPSRTVVTYSL